MVVQECSRIWLLSTTSNLTVLFFELFPWISDNNWRTFEEASDLYWMLVSLKFVVLLLHISTTCWSFFSSGRARTLHKNIFPKLRLRNFVSKQQFSSLSLVLVLVSSISRHSCEQMNVQGNSANKMWLRAEQNAIAPNVDWQILKMNTRLVLKNRHILSVCSLSNFLDSRLADARIAKKNSSHGWRHAKTSWAIC